MQSLVIQLLQYHSHIFFNVGIELIQQSMFQKTVDVFISLQSTNSFRRSNCKYFRDTYNTAAAYSFKRPFSRSH